MNASDGARELTVDELAHIKEQVVVDVLFEVARENVGGLAPDPTTAYGEEILQAAIHICEAMRLKDGAA